jgi:hypothetical protein
MNQCGINMPFEKGHKLAPGGRREGAGRPTKDAEAIKEAFIKKYWEKVGKKHEELLVKYFNSDDAPRDVIKKIIPDAKDPEQTAPTFITNFIQFNNNPLQLPAEDLPTAILVGNGKGDKESCESVASEIRQGQNGLKFHNFTDVPGKRG